MKLAQLKRFVALVDEDMHFPRAADALGIPLASLYTSMEKLEAEVGHPLFTNTKDGKALTPAGVPAGALAPTAGRFGRVSSRFARSTT